MDATDFAQLGYVTNDLDRAIAELREAQGLGPFRVLRDIAIGTANGGRMVGHFGLAFVADLQLEVIQPIAQDTAFYADILPTDGFGLRLHHVGRYYASPQAYAEALARARLRWSIPVEVEAGGGGYAYADTRAELGHYSEMFTFAPGPHLAKIPRY